jgi:hypothetical protein
LDQKLKRILEKKTAYRNVTSLEGSKVSGERIRFLSYLGLSNKASVVMDCKESLVGFRCTACGIARFFVFGVISVPSVSYTDLPGFLSS